MLEIYQELVNLILNREQAALATVVSSKGSAPRRAQAKMLIRRDSTSIGSVGGGGVEQRVREKAIEVMNSGEPQMIHLDLSGSGEQAAMICGGQMDVFIEPILPQEKLYLFGAGHVSQSTAALGKRLGFRVVVIDPRPEYNNNDLLPDADSLIVEEYEDAFPKLNVDKDSYIVIQTPGHVLDEQCLHFTVGTEAKYIGMIGSKKKVIDIKKRLLKKGASQQQLDKVHAPIGIEIGAETPEEIATSILAEIIKVKRNVGNSAKGDEVLDLNR
jgi:xanthine dehydrogenase accessory factor